MGINIYSTIDELITNKVWREIDISCHGILEHSVILRVVDEGNSRSILGKSYINKLIYLPDNNFAWRLFFRGIYLPNFMLPSF